MGLILNRFQWSCILLLLFFLVSCSSKQMLKKPEGKRDFFQETSCLEKLTHEHPDTSVRAQSHLQLAFLYVNHRNPQLNYARALQEMESYLSLTPFKSQTNDFQNWFAALQKIESLQINLEKVQEANKSMRDEVGSLKEMNNNLKETNHKMRETIQKLKSLDRQMEEKRRLTK